MMHDGVWCCEHKWKCKWQGFALHNGLAWGKPQDRLPEWVAAHARECGGQLIQLLPASDAAPESKGLDLEPQRIDQTVTGAKGNCFSACLAMMLGVPLSDVPNFCDAPGFDEDPGPSFMKAAHEWLAARGWGHITMDAPNMLFRRHYSRGYVIAAGMTSRGFLHSVIYKDGQLWHDPHPSHEGIKEVLEVDLIFPLKPFDAARRLRARAEGGGKT